MQWSAEGEKKKTLACAALFCRGVGVGVEVGAFHYHAAKRIVSLQCDLPMPACT